MAVGSLPESILCNYADSLVTGINSSRLPRLFRTVYVSYLNAFTFGWISDLHVYRSTISIMKIKPSFNVLICCLALCACDADRVAKLEKENTDLKAQIEKQKNTALQYDLQAKCSKDARGWFNENWSRDKDTILLDFSNHYNTKQNKCFILVEYHYNSTFAGPGGSSWTNDMTLTDVYENVKYAEFVQNHITNWKPEYSLREEVITCDVQGDKCKTVDEFNNLIRPYMND